MNNCGRLLSILAVATLGLISPVGTADAQARISDADLAVAGIAYEADSSTVRRRLGAPDSIVEGAWLYHDLTVYFKMEDSDRGVVEQILLRTPRYQTARGLRVGDTVEKAVALYGKSCISDALMFCHPEGDAGFDERGMSIENDGRKITGIRFGAVFAI